MKKSSFVKGAMVLVIFNIIGKIIGSIYRLPLAGILGSVGMGKYQLIFPLYCLVLTISTSGIPVAISKLVSEQNSKNLQADSRKLLKISLIVLSIISLVGSIVVVFGARIFAKVQGNSSSYICYYAIAPAVLFVGVLSAFRGFFQGNLMMFPTAISSLVEQIVKLGAGLYLASKFSALGTEYAVFGALAGISISEFCAFLFLLIYYLFYSKRNKIQLKATKSSRFLAKQLVNLSAPITLGGLISPITSMVDSLLVVNLLMFTGFSSGYATMLLGLQSGIVEPLVNIPTILSVSIATALLPSVSKLNAESDVDKIKNLIEKAMQITLSLSLAFFVCFVIFGRQILTFLYGRSLTSSEIDIAVKLLFVCSVNIIFLSMVQVTASILQGLNHQKYPVKTLFVGCTIKIFLDLLLVTVKQINILGAVIAGGVCYFVVFTLNYRKVKQLSGVKISKIYYYISIQECFVCLFAFFVNLLCKMVFGDMVALFIAGVVAGIIFLTTYYIFFMSKTFQQKSASLNLK